MEYVEVTAKFCHPYMNFGGDGCSDVILKYPVIEVKKLYESATSKGDIDLNSESLIDYSEFWSLSFFITFSFWILAKSYGLILTFIRRF